MDYSLSFGVMADSHGLLPKGHCASQNVYATRERYSFTRHKLFYDIPMLPHNAHYEVAWVYKK